MNSNRTVVDLNKVAYANFDYTTTTNKSLSRSKKPAGPTAHGQDIDRDAFAPEVTISIGETWPRETLIERAKRKGLLDEWMPRCRLQLSNSHSLTYTGAKAISIWKEWCNRQFNKHRKKKT